jgi:pimeloyl-ACP methyl ester carboxylesterase
MFLTRTLLALGAAVTVASAQAPKPTIVLVHGAFADGSSFQHIIPILARDGYTVVATANPMSSVDADVTTAKRLIDAQKGPVVVVGHSYGGVIITGAAAGNPNVKALVYLAAFAPDSGESIGAVGSKYPATPLSTAVAPDAAGFLYIDRAKFHDVFCPDVPAAEALIMGATQRPLAGVVFGQTQSVAAWRTIPTWFVVAKNDKAINPDQERFYAKRMKAHTTELVSSHVVMISHPTEVAAIIETAARTTAGQ